jgi:signal recognition particle subunit SRP54
MFESLSNRLTRTFRNLTGRGRLSEENIQETLVEVRQALLEADVALPVVNSFVEQIKEKAIGQEVMTSLTPGQALVKIVHDEIVHLLGDKNSELNFATRPPAVILMAGLQGSGKTTTAAKLAKYLKERFNKSVLVTSADIYRPAAIEQLASLANQIEVDFFPSTTRDNPIDIAKNAIAHSVNHQHDVVIIDTAGRLHIDDDMMNEIRALHDAVSPIETLFVVDSMTGQDAANTAKAFNNALALTGVILTKADGDARGGAALSVRSITGKPIKFIGMGEKVDALEAFHPERIASRLLGMGDILSLVEEAERKVDKQEAKKLAKKIVKGGFDLEDFRDQLQQMRKMGGIAGLLDKMPMMPGLPSNALDDKIFVHYEAIINSMTPQERRFPAILKNSRKLRIAKGSGMNVQKINQLLKQFTQMQKMMKHVSKKGGMQRMLGALQNRLPHGVGRG